MSHLTGIVCSQERCYSNRKQIKEYNSMKYNSIENIAQYFL